MRGNLGTSGALAPLGRPALTTLEPPQVLIRCVLLVLFLVWSAAAEVVVLKPSGAPRGRIFLLHPQGQAWAEKLQSLGYLCAWSSVVSDSPPVDLLKLGDFVVLSGGDSSGAALKTLQSCPEARACALVEPAPDVHLPAAPTRPLLVLGSRLPRTEGQPDWFRRCLLEVQLHEGGMDALMQDNHPMQKAIRQFAVAHSGPPPLGLAGVPFVASPNWSVRSVGEGIDTVVVHATVINTMEGTQRAFLDDRIRRVSAHYVIDRDGTIVQMVDERLAAWHAGVSELEGRSGVNDFSIGVELINLNDGKDPYPEAQVRALVRIIQDLRGRRSIPRSRIVSHAHIARPVGRKSDPLGFDFELLFQLLGD